MNTYTINYQLPTSSTILTHIQLAKSVNEAIGKSRELLKLKHNVNSIWFINVNQPKGAELPAVRKDPFHHHDVALAKRVDELNQALNSPPKKEWVKQHPMNANLKYLPIERVEDTLRKIYGTYKVEVIHYGVIANAVTVHVRIHVIDPVTGDAIFQDGLGAVAIQVEKGAAATDFSKTRSDAIMKNLPAAKSYAIKDAAENFGKIFGSDLNRKDEIIFTSMYKNWEEQQNG